jgi:hypothetical protein
MLKNYTSTVPANRSISYIEEKLAGHKATQILKEYTVDGKVSAVAFMLILNGREMPFKLPARVSECEAILRQSIRRPNLQKLKRASEQAERTAWKIVSDWIDAQMAMIDLTQVEFMEVFLPYVYNPVSKQTFFERIKSQGYKGLLPGTVKLENTTP